MMAQVWRGHNRRLGLCRGFSAWAALLVGGDGHLFYRTTLGSGVCVHDAGGDGGMLRAACCLLLAACCLLLAACCVLRVVCCLLPAVCHLCAHSVGGESQLPPLTSSPPCLTSSSTSSTSHLSPPHLSPLISHLSPPLFCSRHFTSHLSLLAPSPLAG